MRKKSILFIIVLFIPLLSKGEDTLLLNQRYYKQYFYQNGKIASEGFLLNEKPDGYWKSFYITGVKKSEGVWKNYLLDSIWIFYDQFGDTIETVSYFNGKKSGYHKKFFTDNSVKNIVYSTELYVNGKKNGFVSFFFTNGKLQKKIPYIDDNKNGLALEFNNEGVIITITRYKDNEEIFSEQINRYNTNNQKEGVWKTFYSEGKVKEEKTYLNGKLNGYVKNYDDQGYLINTFRYENDELVVNDKEYSTDIDVKEEYDNKGNLIFQGGYLKNTPVGIHRWFNNKGEVIKSEIYSINGELESVGIVNTDGSKNGSWTDYYPDKKIKTKGNFKNNLNDGKWTYYFQDGNIQQTGNYVGGKLNGSWIWYHKNGNILLNENYNYGLRDGESIEYSENGMVVDSGMYIQDYKEGEWITKVGDMILKGRYVMDQKDGLWQQFYSTGEIFFKGAYVQGNPDGKHVFYYSSGKIMEERFYSDGIKISSWIKYKENGEMWLVIQYKDGREYKINGEKIRFDKFD